MTQQPERAIKKKPVDPRKLVEALTPIRETTFEDYEDSQMGSKSRQSEQLLKIMAMKAAKKEKVEVSTVQSLYKAMFRVHKNGIKGPVKLSFSA